MEHFTFSLHPNSWILHPEVGADELAVLAALAHHANSQGQCWPSQTRIAQMLNRSRSWVSTVLGRLVALGFVKRSNRYNEQGGRSSCLYTMPDLTRARVAKTAANLADTLVQNDDMPCRQEQHKPESLEQQESLSIDAREPNATGHELQAVPPDWVPTVADVAWAQQRFPNLDILSFTEMFVLSCQARGYRYANISAAWRRWLLEPKGKPLAPTKPTACPTPHDRNGWQAQVSTHNTAVLAEVDQRIAARRTLRIFSEENQA
jgi:predicted transcriptional regulator